MTMQPAVVIALTETATENGFVQVTACDDDCVQLMWYSDGRLPYFVLLDPEDVLDLIEALQTAREVAAPSDEPQVIG